MRKIINGKMYNTRSAKEIYYWNNGSSHSDFDFCEETLFCKRTGEFFCMDQAVLVVNTADPVV